MSGQARRCSPHNTAPANAAAKPARHARRIASGSRLGRSNSAAAVKAPATNSAGQSAGHNFSHASAARDNSSNPLQEALLGRGASIIVGDLPFGEPIGDRIERQHCVAKSGGRV